MRLIATLVLPDASDFDDPQLATHLGFRKSGGQCFEKDAEVFWGGLGGQPENCGPRIERGIEEEIGTALAQVLVKLQPHRAVSMGISTKRSRAISAP